MSCTAQTREVARRMLNPGPAVWLAPMNGVMTMLYEFLKVNRTDLIARCQAKAAKRTHPGATPATPDNGIPQFLAQLIETFRVEQTPEAVARHAAAGRGKPSLSLVPSNIASTAAMHGAQMRAQGISIDQVVHGYGDLCQALTELAMEKDAPISVDEFHTFNRCLDDAIADAVTAYSGGVDNPVSKSDVPVTIETQATQAQMRNLVEMAVLSFAAIRAGGVGVTGSTSNLHEKCLLGLRDLVDALGDVRPNADVPIRGAAGNVQTPAAI